MQTTAGTTTLEEGFWGLNITGWGAADVAEQTDVAEQRQAAPEDAQEQHQDREGRSRIVQLLSSQWAVAAFAGAIVTVAWILSVRWGLNLLYADARSRLTISRRIVDGTNAGFTQIGTVWLPLPHLLAAPFTAITELWRTGTAVAAINIGAFITTSICIYRITTDLTQRAVAGWAAVIVMCTNPGWLYLHTTALGEPVVFAAIAAGAVGIHKFSRVDPPWSSGLIAIFCGIPTAAAVLARYDGWAFAAAGTLTVAYIAQRRWANWRYTYKCVRAYVALPAVAVGWWLWFNWVNWGDPLEFQRGQWSAQAQQEILAQAGLLPDKGNLTRSLGTFGEATLRGSGLWIAVLGAAGIIAWMAVSRLKARDISGWLLVVVPAGFYVLSLYTGQIALRLGNDTDPSMFNLRYGLQMICGIAVGVGLFIGLASRWGKHLGMAVAIAVVAAALVSATTTWWPEIRDVPVIAEGVQQRELGADMWGAAEWVRTNVVLEDKEGIIAIDDSVHPMLGVIGADLNRVAAPFDGKRWRRHLQRLDVDWIIVDESSEADALAKAIEAHPGFDATFHKVYNEGTVYVYERTAR